MTSRLHKPEIVLYAEISFTTQFPRRRRSNFIKLQSQ